MRLKAVKRAAPTAREAVGMAVILLAAAAVPLLTTNTYYVRLATLVAIASVLASSLNLIYGYAGQISIGHVGFYAVGAYTTAVLMTRYDLGFWVPWLTAILLTTILGWVVGKPVLRLRHFYLAVATLGFGVVVYVVINRWNDVTGGPIGVLGIGRPSIFGTELVDSRAYYVFVVVVALMCLFVIHLLVTSSFGRTLRAIREGEVPVASLGIDPARQKLLAFTISAGFAGLAGGLFASLDRYIGPGSFHVEHSILLLAVLVVGGLGREMGAVAAALLLVLLPELVRAAGENQHLLYAIALLGATLFLPEGIVGFIARLARRVTGSPDRPLLAAAAAQHAERPSPMVSSAQRQGIDSELLSVSDLSVGFGAFLAIDDFDLLVHPGELVGLIGANGAGKSTFINAVTGLVPVRRGQIRFDGRSISGAPMHRIAAAGLIRTFQTTRLFSELTVEENLLVAAARHGTESEVSRLLRLVDLEDDASLAASSLPFGRRRLLELARALAAQPRLLLLDEPAAGLNEAETAKLGDVLLRLCDTGLSIVLVEHDLGLVLGVSDRVVAMGFGQKLAEGTPTEVVNSPAVIEAYLGTKRSAAERGSSDPPHNPNKKSTEQETQWPSSRATSAPPRETSSIASPKRS